MATIPGLQKLPMVAGDGMNTPAFIKAVAPLGGGPVWDTIPGQDPTVSPQWNTFSAGFQKAYGQLGSYTAGGYDDAEIVMNAIKTVITSKNIQPPKNPNDTAASKTFRDAVISAIQSWTSKF